MLATAFYFSNHTGANGIIFWSCVLVAIIVVAFYIVLQLKRQLQDEEVDKNPGASAGFTLSDLRQLHRDGIMSEEEFEKAKAKIIAAARRVAERDSAQPPSGPGTSE